MLSYLFNKDPYQNPLDSGRLQITQEDIESCEQLDDSLTPLKQSLSEVTKIIMKDINKLFEKTTYVIETNYTFFSLLQTKDKSVPPQQIHSDLEYNLKEYSNKCCVLLGLQNNTKIRIVPGSHNFKSYNEMNSTILHEYGSN